MPGFCSEHGMTHMYWLYIIQYIVSIFERLRLHPVTSSDANWFVLSHGWKHWILSSHLLRSILHCSLVIVRIYSFCSAFSQSRLLWFTSCSSYTRSWLCFECKALLLNEARRIACQVVWTAGLRLLSTRPEKGSGQKIFNRISRYRLTSVLIQRCAQL